MTGNKSSADKPVDSKIIALNNYLKQTISFSDDFLFSYERAFSKILSYLMNDKKSKIIFILKYIRVSSIWRLSNYFKLGYRGNVERDIEDLQAFGAIKELSTTDPDYDFMYKIWIRLHPNAKRIKAEKPKLIILSDKFEEAVEEFMPYIYKKYVWKPDFARIEKAKQQYERAYNIEKSQMISEKYINDNKIGNCEICGKIIRNDKEVKTPYKKIGKVIVCATCDTSKVTKEHIRKWIKNK
ncbi:MAG: hypothetical protein R6U52_01385 [Kosmotogaceae bacterium]